MLPTKKFNDLPLVSSVDDTVRIFCIVNGVDSLVSVETLKIIFGSSNTSPIVGEPIDIVNSYSELSGSIFGSEYYEPPYIYKVTEFGNIRINPDTEFSTPFGSGVQTGLLTSSFAQLLISDYGFEYHEAPYIYKRYTGGVFRIGVITDFAIPTGSCTATGIVVDTFANLSGALPGYEYHEMPYIYKKSVSEIWRINIDTDFSEP